MKNIINTYTMHAYCIAETLSFKNIQHNANNRWVDFFKRQGRLMYYSIFFAQSYPLILIFNFTSGEPEHCDVPNSF